MKLVDAALLFGWTLLLPLMLARSALAQEFSEQRLQQACATLQQTPLAASEMQTLVEASRTATNRPALRSRAMAAYSLTFLMQGNTNAFDRALQVMRATYPDALSHVKVTSADCYVMCLECLGSGKKPALCPACMGSGKCKVCSGSGKKGEAPCSACKGKGDCGMCSGKRKITTPCPTCAGSSLVFKPKDTIRNNYSALLSEMAGICQENASFQEQYRLASRETDITKRIALLRALIETYPRRSDLAPAIDLLKQSVTAQRMEESRLRAKDKREREDREREALFKLGDAKTKDLNAAIATLLTYLKEHPDCAGYMELQVLSEQLIARRNRALLMRKIIYGVASLLGLLLAISILRPLVFRRKAEGLSPLPGLDKIDKAQFTDPLKLNAQESKSRVKTRTTEIEPPEM